MMNRTVKNDFVRCCKFSLSAIILLLGWCMLLFSSCDQDKSLSVENVPTGELVTVNFTISGVDYRNDESEENGFPFSGLRSAPIVPNSPGGELKGGATIRLDDDLYISATLVEDPPPVTLRSIPLIYNSQVRIVAYDGSSTAYIDHADYSVVGGGAIVPVNLPLRVPATGTYRFVAYSFHNADPLKPFAETTDSFEVSEDLLWGAQNATINTGLEHVHITVNHMFSQVKMEVKTIGNVINNISGAQITSHDSSKLIVRTGQLAPNSGSMQVFPFTWMSPSNFLWVSDQRLVYTDGAVSGVQIGSITLNGVVYPGPHIIPYNTPLTGGKSYTLRVRFLRQQNFAPRITWEPPSHQFIQGRYALTYDPAIAGLYFKFGSSVGVYSGSGNILSLTPPVASVPPFAITDIPWNITNAATWPNVPFTDTDVNIENFHSGPNVKSGMGDPCRLVGLDLDEMTHPNNFTPVVENGRWRLPTVAENMAFADDYEWQTATDILGGMFTPQSSANSYFLPAAGRRADNNGVAGYHGMETNYWSSTSSNSAQGSALLFNNATWNPNTPANKQFGFPIRCVYDPKVVFEARPWEYERAYDISTTGTPNWQRYDSYLLDGSTYKIRVYSNTTWRIKSIEGEIYTAHGHAARNFQPIVPRSSPNSAASILNMQLGDDMVVNNAVRGVIGDNITIEEITFTVVKDGSQWGRLFVTFESPTGEFPDYELPVIFALPRLLLAGVSTQNRYSYAIGYPYLNQITPFTANGTTYGLNNARRMIETLSNFGYPSASNPNPVVFSRGVEIINRGVNAHLSYNEIFNTIKPDVIHYGYASDANITTTVANDYKAYVDAGGVLIGMHDEGALYLNRILDAFFPGSGASANMIGAAGAMYEFMNVDDMIINGAFGDLRPDPITNVPKHWGEDASETHWVTNPPLSQITPYTYAYDKSTGARLSGTDSNTTPNSGSVNMFRHNTLNFFFMGDGGLTSTPGTVGDLNSQTITPFYLNPVTYFPEPKNPPYTGSNIGVGYGRGINKYPAYNSVLFGNVMTWAMIRAAERQFGP